MEILAFFAGTAFFYFKSPYALFLLCAMWFFRQKSSLLIWFLSAILWSALHQWWIADTGMPVAHLIKKASIMGYITSIPTETANKTQFQFLAERLNGKRIKANLLLSCYEGCPALHAGQRWQLEAKLKKPINLANPGGFDYVAFLGSRHLHWVGNVYRNSFKPLLTLEKTYPLTMLRERLSAHLILLDSDKKSLGIFEALTFGLTRYIDKSQWDLFRRTGTTHLIDISGEHIALVAGLSYWLLKWVWKQWSGRLCLRYPAQKVASAFAILIACAYALIAGFSVPTQRSLIACCLMLLRHVSNQRITIWQSWRYALIAVLVFEPHSVLMLGFYFSFIAVAILVLINQRIKCSGLRKMVSMQLACMFGLMPLSLYWFSYGSINGLVANLVAIPWVGFFIVPLALVVAFLSPWLVIPGSVTLLKWSIDGLLLGLSWIDSFERINVSFTYTEALPPLALMAAMGVFVFMPMIRLFPSVAILVTASCFPQYEKVHMGDTKIDVLDVGQGLSIVVRTAHHTLIYDTGMAFYHGGDMGKLVIIPYLKALGIKNLDYVVISHPDLDHRGGLASLDERYNINELIVDSPRFYKRGVSCHQHPSWQWDDVSFRFFPIDVHFKGRNNNSCILQISNRAGQVLLNGDIETVAEQYLVKTYGNALKSTIMLVPHHGSKTSSSPSFISQVSPRYAIVSYGFDNHYHFPHEQAMRAYKVPVYNTLDCGMVRIHLRAGYPTTPTCYRKPNPLSF